jgi:hypothetical protein
VKEAETSTWRGAVSASAMKINTIAVHAGSSRNGARRIPLSTCWIGILLLP